MIKNFIEITQDSLLSLILIGIIATAFVATMALSPIGTELYSYDPNVLGASTGPTNSNIKFAQLDSNLFEVKLSDDHNFGLKLKVAPITSGYNSDKIFSVENNSEFEKSFGVGLDIPENYKQFIKAGLNVNGENITLLDPGLTTAKVIRINLLPHSKLDVSLFLDLSEDLNFPVEVELTTSN